MIKRYLIATGALLAGFFLQESPRAAPFSAPALELITDRPDFTESSSTVPPLHLQAEAGSAIAWAERSQEATLLGLLLRFGLIKNIELRLGVPTITMLWSDDTSVTVEANALEVGAKLVLPIGDSLLVGLLPFATFPITGDHYETDGISVGVKGVWALELGSRLGLGGNVGMAIQGLGAEKTELEQELLASLSLGIDLTERLATFVEAFSLFYVQAEEIHPFVDAGLTYLLLPTLQLDAYLGTSLRRWPQGFGGLGLSILF